MKNQGVILILFTALISGTSIFINKFGVSNIESTIFTFLKNIIVAFFLLAIILGFKEFKNLKELNKQQWLWLIFIGFIGGSVPFVLFFKGLQISNGPIGSFIHKSMFILVALLATIFLKEQISKKLVIPAFLLLAGNFLLLKMNSFELNIGALLILIATVFWAVENVISKHVLKTIEPKVLAFGRLFFGGIFIMIYILLTSRFNMILTLTFQQISWILISVPFLLLYVITWYTGLKYVKVTTATSILLLGSPITLLLSSIFLNISVTLMQAIGILFTLIGILSIILFIEKKTYSEPTISTAYP